MAPKFERPVMTAPLPPIAIAGGGIGGLATAIALAQRGIPSIVFEQRATSCDDGAGIQLGPNATRALTDLGIADQLRSAVCVPDALCVLDGRSGRKLTRLPLGSWISARHGTPYWTAHRQDLHAALHGSALKHPLITINHGATVQSFDQTTEAVSVQLDDGLAVSASALVCADGLWSRLRSMLDSRGTLRATGKCAYRAVVSLDRLPTALRATSVQIWLGPRTHAVIYPVRAGRAAAIVVIVQGGAAHEGWAGAEAQEPNRIREGAGLFPGELGRLLEQDLPWRTWALQSLSVAPTRNNGRVALLGDAANPIQPYFAQGAAMALEDAVTLAKCVDHNRENIAFALEQYARRRHLRSLRVAHLSKSNGDIYQFTGLRAAGRNAVLRLAPATCLMSRYDWIYDFRP